MVKNSEGFYPESTSDLTQEQKTVVNFRNEGDLLVRGMPGCGKTTVIVRRAIKFISDYEKLYGEGNERILIVAYNKSLVCFVDKLLQHDREVSESLKKRIDVRTFHSLAWKILKSIDASRRKNASQEQKRNSLNKALNARRTQGKHRLLEKNQEFWEEEIEWMKGWLVTTREQYMKMPRTGRGTSVRVSAPDKEIIFDVYECYQEELEELGVCDWDDMALDLFQLRGDLKDEHKFDHVLVDEAQDFPPAWLIGIRFLAKKSLTIAADVAQKIYKRGFSFKDCGISVSGQRSKTLGKTFRCTRSTVMLAQAVRDQMTRLKVNNEVAELPMPEHVGSLPRWIHRDSKEDALDEMVRLMKKVGAKRSFNVRNVVVVARRNKDLRVAQAALKSAGLPAQLVFRDQLSLDGEFIPLTTEFQVKGLEFNHVFIWGLCDSVMPGAGLYYMDEDEDPEDILDYERALLYVAITRAREGVWLFSYKLPTRFLEALDSNLYEKI